VGPDPDPSFEFLVIKTLDPDWIRDIQPKMLDQFPDPYQTNTDPKQC
jgi:hypothetical protein